MLRKKILIALGALILLLLAAVLLFLPDEVEKRANRTRNTPPYPASKQATELHKRLLVTDLHADTLTRSTRGHVDVPRLIEGGVALQAFTIVTKAPRGLNIESNDDKSDMIIWAALLQLWPPRTWGSLTERALYQAQRLQSAAGRSGGKLTLITTKEELQNYLARRREEPAITAGFLGVEGAHALDGNLENIDRLFDSGIRMMAPTHFFDNDISGSAHGVEKGGLTEKGREMIRRMETKGMLVDLAHASPKTTDDVLAMATRPVVVSHTGVKGTCDNRRNLSDKHLRGVSATGGVVGIGVWRTAVCGDNAKAIANAIRYTSDLIGVEHVGLGSDFDGAITAPFDVTGFPQITEALLAEGFSEEEIRLILGGNTLRVLEQVLP
jgi:microsomal dipeptidase-like Zn-dependent dipeptidase